MGEASCASVSACISATEPCSNIPQSAAAQTDAQMSKCPNPRRAVRPTYRNLTQIDLSCLNVVFQLEPKCTPHASNNLIFYEDPTGNTDLKIMHNLC